MSIVSPTINQRTGFTVVELLIVIVVIGILAAITIVAYNGIQNRAYDSTVQSDLSSMAKKVEIEAANTGSYVLPTPATGIAITKSAYNTVENNVYFCKTAASNRFVLSARSKSGKTFKYLDGAVQEHPAYIQAVATCSLVGETTPTGNSTGGWNATTQQWSSWVGRN